ncbi:hypothetical protein MMC13_008319 [Lambiella insularis]|nr:hypothetical protein [Lambiella insularis]
MPKLNPKKSRASLKNVPPSDSDESDSVLVDIVPVVFEQFRFSSEKELDEIAKSRLHNETQNCTTSQSEEQVVFANPQGHSLMDDLAFMKQELMILKSWKDKKTIEDGQAQKRLLLLESRLRQLTSASDSYMAIRRRFFDTYKRDVLKMTEFRSTKAIQAGNAHAHNGDSVTDALLFKSDSRQDRSIYRDLYGLDYQSVLDLHAESSDNDVFLVLDTHATLLVSGQQLSSELKVAFDSFVRMVEEYFLQAPAANPNSPLGCAYYTFWKVYNAQPH